MRLERTFHSLLLLLAAAPLCAQQSAEPAEVVPDLVADSRLVMLDALVTDPKTGRKVADLTAEDFTLSEDAAPQQIKNFSQDRIPLSIVLLFDQTDSVRPVVRNLSKGALAALAHLKPEDEVAVMGFSSTAHLEQGFTHNHQLAAQAIEAVANQQTSAATFIDEDVYQAVNTAMQASMPGSRKVLLFLTDDTANYVNALTLKLSNLELDASLHSRDESLRELLERGVTVAALIDRSKLDVAAHEDSSTKPVSLALGTTPRFNDVQHYAELTGGPVLNTDKKHVADKLADLIDEIRQRYTISYVPTAHRPDGSFCRLTLALTPQAYEKHPELRAENFEVRARTGYYR